MKTVITMCCLALMFIGGAFLTQTSQIQKAEWLLGTWENQTPRGSIYEEWEQTSTRELAAKSFAIVENDTIVFETIRLIEDDGDLLYIPAVRNQNEGKPVVFKSEKLTETEMVFSNPEHDFPQFISYTKISADSLVAAIYGTANGQERRVTFPMRKVK